MLAMGVEIEMKVNKEELKGRRMRGHIMNSRGQEVSIWDKDWFGDMDDRVTRAGLVLGP